MNLKPGQLCSVVLFYAVVSCNPFGTNGQFTASGKAKGKGHSTPGDSASDGRTDSGQSGMFTSWSEQWLEDVDTNQRNYGMAVTDIDHDGKFDIVVAGFNGPNLVLKYDKDAGAFINIATKNSPFEALRDVRGQAIGVGACDIDGDGHEEIYFLNTNDAYAGISSYDDKLFKWRDGHYVDLFADLVNVNVSAKSFAGRSVACLDRYGIGKYGFLIATYGRSGSGTFSLIEMNEFHTDNDSGRIVLSDAAEEAGIKRSTGGRGVVVGPILNYEGRSDILFVNEGNTFLENRGDNYLFKNLANGTFIEIAKQLGVADDSQAGRGVTLADFNQDGLLDIVCGNYDGPNRLYIQKIDQEGKNSFVNIATPEMEVKRFVRTVIVADFDNDGNPEIFFNNINGDKPQPNTLFTVTSYGPNQDPGITQVDIGDASETDGYGTGAVYLDADDDGRLDLVVSHGESVAQPIEVYRSVKASKNNQYLRVYVLTKYGAPARGASVQLLTKAGKQMTQVVDGGSGYLCQMEPVVHFGLGTDRADKIVIHWPGGKSFVWYTKDTDINKTLLFYHPDYLSFQAALKASNMTAGSTTNLTGSHTHVEL